MSYKETVDYTITNGQIFMSEDGIAFKPVGDCSEFTITLTPEELKHYSHTTGLPTVDKTATTRQEITASFTCDEPTNNNFSNFFMATLPTLTTQPVDTNSSIVFEDAEGGYSYFVGDYNISNVSVYDSTSTLLTENTDYKVTTVSGEIYMMEGFTTGDITVFWDTASTGYYQGNATSKTSISRHFKFTGSAFVGYTVEIVGYCTITPNGDLPFITGDSPEWMTMSFNVTFEKHSTYGNYPLKYTRFATQVSS